MGRSSCTFQADLMYHSGLDKQKGDLGLRVRAMPDQGHPALLALGMAGPPPENADLPHLGFSRMGPILDFPPAEREDGSAQSPPGLLPLVTAPRRDDYVLGCCAARVAGGEQFS